MFSEESFKEMYETIPEIAQLKFPENEIVILFINANVECHLVLYEFRWLCLTIWRPFLLTSSKVV